MHALALLLSLLVVCPAQVDPWSDPDAIIDALERPLDAPRAALRPGLVPAPTVPALAPAPALAPDPLPAAAESDETCGPQPPGWLSVNTDPWTRVIVDGAELGSTPLFRTRLAPGDHEVRLWNEAERVDLARTVTVESRHTTKLHVFASWRAPMTDVVTRAPGALPAPAEDCAEVDGVAGFVSIDTLPWARVFIDGKPVGSTPLFKHRVKPGGHVVRLERHGADGAPVTMQLRIEVSLAETVKIVLDADDPVDRGS